MLGDSRPPIPMRPTGGLLRLGEQGRSRHARARARPMPWGKGFPPRPAGQPESICTTRGLYRGSVTHRKAVRGTPKRPFATTISAKICQDPASIDADARSRLAQYLLLDLNASIRLISTLANPRVYLGRRWKAPKKKAQVCPRRSRGFSEGQNLFLHPIPGDPEGSARAQD